MEGISRVADEPSTGDAEATAEERMAAAAAAAANIILFSDVLVRELINKQRVTRTTAVARLSASNYYLMTFRSLRLPSTLPRVLFAMA